MDIFAPTAELENRGTTLFRLVDANIIGVATCDADGRILEANDAYLDMLGYSRDDLTSQRIGWRDLTPPEWKDVSMRAVAEIQATGHCAVFEKEYFRKDGTGTRGSRSGRADVRDGTGRRYDDRRELVAGEHWRSG
jgi:PAS domain S-box-containing protein